MVETTQGQPIYLETIVTVTAIGRPDGELAMKAKVLACAQQYMIEYKKRESHR